MTKGIVDGTLPPGISIPFMDFFLKARSAAIKAQMQLCEADRLRILSMVTDSKVNLAEIADLMVSVDREMRTLSKRLKVLEMPDPQESAH